MKMGNTVLAGALFAAMGTMFWQAQDAGSSAWKAALLQDDAQPRAALFGWLSGSDKKKKEPDDFLSAEGFANAMQQVRDHIGADAQVVRISTSDWKMSVEPKASNSFVVYADTGKLREYSDSIPDAVSKSVPLSSIDLLAIRDRMAAKVGDCDKPTWVSLQVLATGNTLAYLACSDEEGAPIYSENHQGEIIPEVDLATREGILAAWRDMEAAIPPDEKITSGGVNVRGDSGYMLLSGANTLTTRYSDYRSAPNGFLLSQNTRDPSDLNYILMSDISSEQIARTLDGAWKTCENKDFWTLQVNVPGTKGERGWIIVSMKDSCNAVTWLDGVAR